MSVVRNRIVHQEVIELDISPAQVREFIMTPERILDYYPGALEGGVIEQGSSFFCWGKSGVSLLELMHAESSEQLLVVKVTTATRLSPPFTESRIKASTFFTMIEDWEIMATPTGSRLTKTWRDIRKARFKFLPMALIVRLSARKESATLKRAWNRYKH